MPIPRAVQQAGERSEQLARDAGLTGVPPGPTSQNDPPADPAPQPQTPPQNGPAPAQPPADRSNPNPNEDYKTRYENLRKSRDERVDRLQSQNDDLQRQNGALQARLEMLESQMNGLRQEAEQAKTAAVPQPATFSPQQVLESLSEEDREHFSPESFNVMLKMMNQVAQSVAAQQVQPVQQELQGVRKYQTETREQTFWRMINEQVPHWRELAKTPEFEDFMHEYDPVLGMTRQQAVDEAQGNLNHERIIGIYRQYTGPQPSSSQDTGYTDPPIHPNDAGGEGGAPEFDEAPTFTESQVHQFYNDVANRKYVGKQDEAARIEAQIIAAQEAGKIVPG